MALNMEIPQDILSKSPKEILEHGKKFIGMETEPVEGRYAVEYDPIRRYCHMTGETNPLYLDPEYAKNTKYGEVICPPLLVPYFAEPGVWPPVEEFPLLLPVPIPPAGSDRAGANTLNEYEILKPVKVGDRLSSKQTLEDVYMKAIRIDPEAIWCKIKIIISNQNDEVVVVQTVNLVNYRKEVKGDTKGESK